MMSATYRRALLLFATALVVTAEPISQSVPAPEVSTREESAVFQSKVTLIEVPVVVQDKDGKPVGTLRQEDFQLFDKGKPQIISRFSVEKAEMASGTFDLKVAFSSGAASFGSVQTHLTIDPWEPSKFLLSGLALSQSTHPASPAGLGDVDLFGDNVPLTVSGVQFIPAGTNRFLKQEKAFIYGEICEPSLAVTDRKSDPGLGAQLTVLDGKTGQPVKSPSYTGLKPETVPGTSAVPFDIALPIDELAPGSYIAQVIAQDAVGNRSIRTIGFELER